MTKQYQFWRVNWLPIGNRLGLFWGCTEIPADQANPNGTYPPDPSENVLGWISSHVNYIGEGGPKINWVWKIVYNFLRYTFKPIYANGPLRNMIPVDNGINFRIGFGEFSVDPKDRWQVISVLEKYYAANEWSNCPIEISLTKCDPFNLSAWNWPGLDYIIKFDFQYFTDPCVTDAQKAELHSHLQGIWDALKSAGIKFKAHWGKVNFFDHEFVAKNYNLNEFQHSISTPFLSDYLRPLLLPVPKKAD